MFCTTLPKIDKIEIAIIGNDKTKSLFNEVVFLLGDGKFDRRTNIENAKNGPRAKSISTNIFASIAFFIHVSRKLNVNQQAKTIAKAKKALFINDSLFLLIARKPKVAIKTFVKSARITLIVSTIYLFIFFFVVAYTYECYIYLKI